MDKEQKHPTIEELNLTMKDGYHYKVVSIDKHKRFTYENDDYYETYCYLQALRRKLPPKQIKTYYHGMEVNL